jgi:hypothetical protein
MVQLQNYKHDIRVNAISAAQNLLTERTGRARCIPLPPDLTRDLRRHISGMPNKKPIWQMPTQIAQLLRDDLKLTWQAVA